MNSKFFVIYDFCGNYITKIIDENGKPNIHAGRREDAIVFSDLELNDILRWIGAGYTVEFK